MQQTAEPTRPAETRAPEYQLELAQKAAASYRQLLSEMRRVIIGQEDVVGLIVLGLFCRGHCILEGVPGLAKTLMISSIARLLALKFGRIQFTPDLLPSDITGTEILEEEQSTGKRVTRFIPGPVFTHVLLADEINRTPPKTQSALLQAMQEYHVTVAGEHHAIESPFFVLGTQNPIEQEGTYPLPEAQLDRFLLKIKVDYPTLEQEIDVAISTTGQDPQQLDPILSRDEILAIQGVVREVLVARPVASYAVRLVRASRPQDAKNPESIRKYLTWGAGPRACQALLLGAKARALVDGRVHASVADIRFVAKPVLRHRLVTSFTAESDSVTADDVIDRLLEHVPEFV
jgi:MoxR-like ATPase